MNYIENNNDEQKSREELIEEIQFLRNSLKNLQKDSVEEESLIKSGERYKALFHNSPLGISHFEPDEVIERDITERKETENYALMLAQALRSTSECVSITDMNDRFLFVNSAFVNTYGFQESELYGKDMSIIRSPNNSPEIVKEILPKTIAGGWKGELLNKRKNGTEFPISLSTSVVLSEDGKPIALVGVANDITESKHVELELIEAKEKAQESDRLKTEFLAQMSHEIRTPINTILNFIYLIKADLQDKMTDDLQVGFEAIDNGARRLIRTIDLILNMSQVQAGYIEINAKPIELNKDIFMPLLREFVSSTEAKGITLEFHNEMNRDCWINADLYTTIQIFSNLLENAIKYTHKGGIKISIDSMEDSMEEKRFNISISDTGIGISEEYLDKLFTPFSQEETGYTRRFEGNGLGLALVKKYCELNEAEVSVKSKKGVGSTFIVSFPAL
ncbi:MAG: PAS domain-containing sensor histidine kinase [Bacteroidota bacterium]|nr:PAS domain-containing sensor histidine kinase [Bacteroidota bacterium]